MPTDRIALRGIRAWAHHGVLAHEADVGQEFLVDVVMQLDLRVAGDSDDLADTVDYGAIAALVHDRVTGPRRDLVEAVAADVAAAVLAHDDRIDAVDVTIHKPAAPVTVALDDVEIHVHRGRAVPS